MHDENQCERQCRDERLPCYVSIILIVVAHSSCLDRLGASAERLLVLNACHCLPCFGWRVHAWRKQSLCLRAGFLLDMCVKASELSKGVLHWLE